MNHRDEWLADLLSPYNENVERASARRSSDRTRAVEIKFPAAGLTIAVAPQPYVTVRLAACISGLSEKAIHRKIEDGTWIEDREFRRLPDSRILIDLRASQRWVEWAAA